jgi:hypothetical protein
MDTAKGRVLKILPAKRSKPFFAEAGSEPVL